MFYYLVPSSYQKHKFMRILSISISDDARSALLSGGALFQPLKLLKFLLRDVGKAFWEGNWSTPNNEISKHHRLAAVAYHTYGHSQHDHLQQPLEISPIIHFGLLFKPSLLSKVFWKLAGMKPQISLEITKTDPVCVRELMCECLAHSHIYIACNTLFAITIRLS